MAEMKNPQNCREQICVSCNRIMDSCRDKDCFENVRVYLDDCGQQCLERSSTVRVKCANIAWTSLAVDPVQFNSGFYSVNIRFYLRVTFEFCLAPGRVQEAQGIAVAEKKVILFGGDGSVSTFRSIPGVDGFCTPIPPIPEEPCACCCDRRATLPTAVCEVADPVILDAKILEDCHAKCTCVCCMGDIPQSLWNGCVPQSGGDENRYLAISFGLFSVIRLERPGQFVISASEYSVPEKECCEPPENDPCAMFRRMQFPVGEFSTGCPRSCSCGC